MSGYRVLGLAAAVAAVAALGSARADEAGTDGEGFIKVWLVAGPFPLADDQEPADAVDEEQVAGEAKLEPQPGDKAKGRSAEATWKKAAADEFYIDLNGVLGEHQRAAAYLVCRIESPKEQKAMLKIGSDDQCKVYLNGKPVFKHLEDRPVDKDQDEVADVTLKQGTNVLVMKVINNYGEWKACARFTDAGDNPLQGLKASAAK